MTGPFLLIELPWRFRSNAISFLVCELCMQILFPFVMHNDIYGIYYIILKLKKRKNFLLNEKEFHSYIENLQYWRLGFLT